MVAIQIENLHKVYKQMLGNDIHALQGISLKVQQGQICGLLGPNGAGKTTLVRILLSIIKPTSGEVKVFDDNPSKTSIKNRLSYLAENHVYPKHLTGEQVLQYFGWLGGASGQPLREKINKTLEVVGMTKWRKTKMRKYSKGMTQRIGLAQTLINDSDLLFLDEPTDGIDALGRKEIRDLLLRLKEQGKTIFLNSHLLSEVEQICDHVAIMNKGKIIKQGNIESLVAKNNTYKIKIPQLPQNVREKIEEKIISLVEGKEDEYLFTTKEEEQLDFIIDTLRKENLSIRYIIPERQSLEDYFVDVIEQETK